MELLNFDGSFVYVKLQKEELEMIISLSNEVCNALTIHDLETRTGFRLDEINSLLENTLNIVKMIDDDTKASDDYDA